MPTKKSSMGEDNIWAAAGYLWILSVVALAARKDNDYIRFHASQGSLIFIISIPMFFIPIIGWMINVILGVLAVIGIIKALQGEKWELPVLGGPAKQFGNWLIKTLKL